MGLVAYVPGPRTDFIELSKTPTGRLFRKQLLSFGSFKHPNLPGEKLTIDADVASKLVDNFRAGIADIVQVPIVDGKNQHSEDPLRNAGEVVDLTVETDHEKPEDNGVYAAVDVRKPEYADELGKTLLGASAMMHMDYTDTKTGDKVGPTLLHVAITNRPYITNLNGFEEVIAASADDIGDDEPVVFSPPKESTMDKDQMIAALRDEHGIDVEDLQRRADAASAVPDEQQLTSALTNVLTDAGIIKASASEEDGEQVVTVQDVAEAVIEMAGENKSLSEQVVTLTKKNEDSEQREAEREVEKLIEDGKVLPKQKDVMVRLARTDRESFEAMIPDDAIVELTERGVGTHEEPDSEQRKQAEEEIERLADDANASRLGSKKAHKE